MKEKTETATWLLQNAVTQLGTGNVDTTKYFIQKAIENIERQQSNKYALVIENLYNFFYDESFTYTKLMEELSMAQCEIMNITNELIDRTDKDDPRDITLIRDTQAFFFKMNLLLWNLKPIAVDSENAYNELLKKNEK